MRRFWGLALIVSWACSATAPVAAPTLPRGASEGFVAGYHPWWGGDAWTDYGLSALDRLYLFEFELDPEGGWADTHGWPGAWRGLVDAALEADVSVVPVVTLHPEDSVERLLLDPVAIDRAAASIATLVAAHPELDGVHLDLEIFRAVPEEARAGYVDLARGVRERLLRLDRATVLSVFLPALDVDDAYDEAGLTEVVDYAVVQGYDLHHRTGPRAGPVAPVAGWAPLDWEHVVERLSDLGLEPASLLMGVPLYGTRWPTEGPEPGSPTRGVGVTIPLAAPPDVVPELPRAGQEAERVGRRRDPSSGSPYYTFRDDQGWIQGWFEDEESLEAKRAFVERRGLGGVAYFPLAYAPPRFWTELVRRRDR